MSKLLLLALLLSLTASAAETWRWLGVSNTSDAGMAQPSYGGFSCDTTNNWLNAASGTNGIPRSGDSVIVTGRGRLGGDFKASLAFAGVSVSNNVPDELVSQGTLGLQAGGAGLVIASNVTSVGTVNGSIAFAGRGEGIVDIANAACRVKVQKSFYGSADVTLVKRGAGTLQANDGYAPHDNVSGVAVYTQARSTTGGYYPHRKFVFGGVKLQGGALDLRLYYWLRNCDIQFDGDATSLNLMKFRVSEVSGAAGQDLGVHCLELCDCRLRETERVTAATHAIFGEDARCHLHFFGDATGDSSFSGRLTGAAGLVWEPGGAATFSFTKSVSPTTGFLAVSNGTVRVADGAALPGLASVAVGTSGVFRVETTAGGDYSAVPFAVAAGGRLAVAAGQRLKVRSLTVAGETLAPGVYAAGAWLTGGGEVVVGAVTADWNGSGDVTTLANWPGRASLPPLEGSLTSVNVAGGTSLVANVDAAFAGVRLGATPFALSAAEGHTLALGAEGLTNAVNGAVTLGDGVGRVLLAADQPWSMGAGRLTLRGAIDATNGAAAHVRGAVPAFASGARIGCGLWLFSGGAITCPAGGALTFDAPVSTTNTQSLSVTAPEGATIAFNALMMSRNGGTLGGAGRIVFNDSVHFRDRPNMSGSVVVELHKDHNHLSGNMGTFSGGTLKCMAPYVITRSSPVRQRVATPGNSADNSSVNAINAKDDFTLDLNGFDQSIDLIAMHADGAQSGGRVTSPTPATLRLQSQSGFWAQHNYQYGYTDYKAISTANGYGYETMDKGTWEGAVCLSYEATAGKVRSMMRLSSTTGSLTVASGTLVFLRRARTAGETFDLKGGSANPCPRLADEDGAWPLARAVTVTGGVLKLEHSLAFGRDVEIALATGGSLDLDAGVTQACRALTLDGRPQSAGRFYTSADTPLITGRGRLYVRGDVPTASLQIR